MRLVSALGGGLAGALALTLLHETVRRSNKNAPRMDKLGMQAIGQSLEAVDLPVPGEKELFTITMAGDVISNSLYYSLAAVGGERQVIVRGALLGLAAGFGGVYLPEPLGLSTSPSNRTIETKWMTVGYYLLGGVVASITSKLIENIYD